MNKKKSGIISGSGLFQGRFGDHFVVGIISGAVCDVKLFSIVVGDFLDVV